MMPADTRASLVFLGDELSATGYRLAGAEVRVPPAGELVAAFEQACREARVVVVTAELAARLDAQRLARAQAAVSPCVLIVPDVRNQSPMPDLGVRARGQLGIEP